MVTTRPFSLSLYLLLAFAFSWPFQIVGQLWATSISALVLCNGTSMIMVTVATFVAGRYLFRDGFAGAGWSWGRPWQYGAVVGFAGVLWLAVPLLKLALGLQFLPPGIASKDTLILLAWTSPVTVLLPGFGEEFGWRGYMLPRLVRRWPGRTGVLIHGIIWWAWHLPILVGTGMQVGAASAGEIGLPVPVTAAISGVMVAVASAIPAVLHGVVFAYIWMRSRSLAVATVYHATYDGFRDSIGVTFALGPLAGLWANALLIAAGIVLLWKADWSILSDKPMVKAVQPERALTE